MIKLAKLIFIFSFLFLNHSIFTPQVLSTQSTPFIDKPAPAKTVKFNEVECKQIQLPVGKFGGVLNLSTFGSGPKTFNLWASTDNTSTSIGGLLFDSLFENDPDTGEVVPHLAKEYKIFDNGKTILVKLRKGVKWSDGVPVTSDDVVFTWNEIIFKGLEGGGFQSLCLIDGKFPAVKKIDDYTVEFKTHIVFAPFLRQIGYPPAPKHIFEPLIKGKKIDDAKKTFLAFWGTDTKPDEFVTNGPFRLLQYIQGERIEFVKNPGYFVINTKNQKLPYVDKLVYTLVQDPSLELFKFFAGEIDVVSIRGEDVALVKNLEKKGNFKVANLGPSTGTEFLLFNLNRDKKREPAALWFNNVYFRQGVSNAIDRTGIVDNVLAGVGKPLFTAESLASIYLNKKIAQGYSQDFELSRKLLKEGGFKWNDKGQLLYKSNNKEVTFTILTNAENITRQSIGVIIQDDLKKLGMKVNLRPLDFNTLIGRSDSGDWEAIIIGFTGGFFEPNEGANVWKLNGRLHMFDNVLHKPRDWEIEIDRIFNEATRYVDFKTRKKLYDRFQEVVYEQLPFIYLVSPIRIAAFQNTLGNIRPTIYGGVLYNLDSIYKTNI